MKGGSSGEPCKFFARGQCRKGAECRFVHAREPCKLFAKGRCFLGAECSFAHTKTAKTTVRAEQEKRPQQQQQKQQQKQQQQSDDREAKTVFRSNWPSQSKQQSWSDLELREVLLLPPWARREDGALWYRSSEYSDYELTFLSAQCVSLGRNHLFSLKTNSWIKIPDGCDYVLPAADDPNMVVFVPLTEGISVFDLRTQTVVQRCRFSFKEAVAATTQFVVSSSLSLMRIASSQCESLKLPLGPQRVWFNEDGTRLFVAYDLEVVVVDVTGSRPKMRVIKLQSYPDPGDDSWMMRAESSRTGRFLIAEPRCTRGATVYQQPVVFDVFSPSSSAPHFFKKLGDDVGSLMACCGSKDQYFITVFGNEYGGHKARIYNSETGRSAHIESINFEDYDMRFYGRFNQYSNALFWHCRGRHVAVPEELLKPEDAKLSDTVSMVSRLLPKKSKLRLRYRIVDVDSDTSRVTSEFDMEDRPAFPSFRDKTEMIRGAAYTDDSLDHFAVVTEKRLLKFESAPLMAQRIACFIWCCRNAGVPYSLVSKDVLRIIVQMIKRVNCVTIQPHPDITKDDEE